eukprot:15066151-Alexandrium_andersonii.AAC.1
MSDAAIADIPRFRDLDSDAALAEPVPSGVRGARSDAQAYRDDITWAVLDPGLIESARAEEIRFMESWHAWGVRP